MNQISADSRIQNRFSALGYRSNIGVRIESQFVDGGDNFRWVFILDTEAFLRNRADMQAGKFGGAVAKHELTTRLLHLNSSQRAVA